MMVRARSTGMEVNKDLTSRLNVKDLFAGNFHLKAVLKSSDILQPDRQYHTII